jgi:zinc protease
MSVPIRFLLRAAVAGFFVPVTPLVAGAQDESAAADLTAPLPIDSLVTVGTLSNGVRYYIRVNERPEDRAELRLVLNAGSVLEDDDQQGLAHFVEHMAFNGTSRFPKQDLIDYLESIGMRFGPDVNAYTSFDETVYMLTVPTDSAEVVATAFRILEDWARTVSFDPEEIEKERGVVLEEWRLGRGAEARMRDEQFPILFQGSRYAERLPIGQRETLENFDHESLVRYYEDWYRPDLMAVIAVGDLDPIVIEELIRERFEGVPAAPDGRVRQLYEVPEHDETLFAVATDDEATDTRVSVVFKQPVREQGTVGAYRQGLVERLYNRMLNARLFELTLAEDPPFTGAGTAQGRFVRSSEAYLLAAQVREGGVEIGLQALLTEAERVDQHGFTASELERHKLDLLRAFERAYDERAKRNSVVYASEFTRNFLEDEPIPGIEYEYELTKELLPTIQLSEVNERARQWISERNRVVLLNAPANEDVAVPGERELLAVFERVEADEIAAYEDELGDAPLIEVIPEPAAIVREEVIEEVEATVWELANGIKVTLKPTDFKDDEILFRAWSPGGTSLVPDPEHVPAMTAASVVAAGGLGSYSLVELNKVLAGKAATVNPSISELYEGLSGRASPQDAETLFQLIHLYFTAPRLDSTAFTAYRNSIQAELENRDSDPEAAFWDTVSVTLAQNHHRRRPPTVEKFDEMDLTTSFSVYEDRFADAGDFNFVFVGSFDLDSIRPLVQTYLGGLRTTGRKESWRDIELDYPEGVIRKTVERGIEPKSLTFLAFNGRFDDTGDQRYALSSLEDVLRLRLREHLREDLGGTYGVRIAARTRRLPDQEYSFQISFGSAPDRVEELVAEARRQIDSMKVSGPTGAEVEKVREAQRRAWETALKENGFWLGQLVARDQHGEDYRQILEHEERFNTLSVDLLREAARRYLSDLSYVQITLVPEGGD